MKKLVLLLTVISFFTANYAAPVSERDAAVVAKSFCIEKMANFNSSDAITLAEEVADVYYRFNIGEKGFVIVSASDLVSPILAYSFENDFVENPAANYLLDRYSKEIADIEGRRAPQNQRVSEVWTHYMAEPFMPDKKRDGEELLPLLTTTWNQNMFHNTYCPWDIYAGAWYDYRVPNGCVALAMSMIMNFYQYPEHGVGGVSYVPYGYDRQTVYFSQQHYNYAAMPDNLNFYAGQMSHLVYHCGVAVKMGYTPFGSGSTELEAKDQFETVFKYNKPALVGPAMFPDYGDALREELSKKHPLFYTASNSGGGHAFVIDGFDADGLFHVNWGWGGSSNGYFQIENLDADGSGDPYNNGENALFNLYPSTGYPAQCAGEQHLTASFGTITNGSARQPYDANSDCSWVVAVKDALKYTFTFSYLNTEPDKDVITIYNGPTVASGVAGTFSGYDVAPQPLDIVGADSVLVTFTYDADNSGSGFVLQYSTILEDQFCNQQEIVSVYEGEITDGSGDEDYRHETFCTWLIQPAEMSKLHVTFPEFDLREGDFLDVYDNSKNPAVLLERYDMDNYPYNTAYPTSKIKIVFVADNYINGGGFKINWHATTDIAKYGHIDGLTVYPNPATDFINVRLSTESSDHVTCTLYDMTGKTLSVNEFDVYGGDSEKQIKLPSSLSKGFYFLDVETGKGKTVTKVLIQ
ncbi:MAG: C10 family peptidase [Bacteroidales bacterium]|nr:C10 family peptidase [Bacteroidales bacterium]